MSEIKVGVKPMFSKREKRRTEATKLQLREVELSNN